MNSDGMVEVGILREPLWIDQPDWDPPAEELPGDPQQDVLAWRMVRPPRGWAGELSFSFIEKCSEVTLGLVGDRAVLIGRVDIGATIIGSTVAIPMADLSHWFVEDISADLMLRTITEDLERAGGRMTFAPTTFRLHLKGDPDGAWLEHVLLFVVDRRAGSGR